MVSHKHAHNLVMNEDKLLTSSYKKTNIQPSIIQPANNDLINQSNQNIIKKIEQDEINWLYLMSLKQSCN